MTTPFVEPYPDEVSKIGDVFDWLQRTFEFAKFSNDTGMMAQFLDAARTKFGEIGFEVDIHFDELWVDGKPSGVFQPTVEISGRTRPETETDHDRVRYGVVKGLADGQAGYVREDGTKREDPKSKDIL